MIPQLDAYLKDRGARIDEEWVERPLRLVSASASTGAEEWSFAIRDTLRLFLGSESARVAQRVDRARVFVAPDRFDSRKTQGQSTSVTRTRLDGIERDFEHNVRLHFTIPTMIDKCVLFEMFG